MDMSSFQVPGNPFSNAPRPQNPMRPKRPGPLALTVIALVILGSVLVGMSGFYADLLWFRSVDFQSVWSTVLVTKISLFVFFGLITSLFITSNIYLAFKSRPLYAPVSIEADNLERYRGQLDPIRRWVLLAIALGFFYFSGTSGIALWEKWLQFKNATSFGVKDSQFGLDISFFVFKLPFFEALIAWAISTLVLTIIATYLGHGYDDEAHQHELHLAFINWAEKSLGCHRYQLGEFGNIQPISISHVMPQPTTPVFENDTSHFVEAVMPQVEYV
jgi:uncharacterized membrane protein (UPF0182 family)